MHTHATEPAGHMPAAAAVPAISSELPAALALEVEPRFFVPLARWLAQMLDVPQVVLLLCHGQGYAYTRATDHSEALQGDPAGMAELACAAAAGQYQRDALKALRMSDGSTPQFLASQPIHTPAGEHVGAFCAMDPQPRAPLDAHALRLLRDTAELAGQGVALRSQLLGTEPATQLPNRLAFFEALRRQVGRDGMVWLAAVEIAPVQRFNAFIRALGHRHAEELTRAVAERVRSWMSPGMQLFQVGVTRFAVLLHPGEAMLDTTLLDGLIARLRQPFVCFGLPLTIQPGIGLLPVHAQELAEGDPLRRVMSASHSAQQNARGWAMYQREQDEQHRQEFLLVTELAAALASGEQLQLYYQPRVSARGQHCVTVEALARWQHPRLGMVPPQQFIALAERAGLMRSLSHWVLQQGLGQLGQWRRQGLELQLSLNLSGGDVGSELVQQLTALAEHHAVPLSAVELEFTETVLMERSQRTRHCLDALVALGCRIAIDDFGTGYSNLSSLRHVPATVLKIDQSFVRQIADNPNDATIVRSIVTLAHQLGFRVVLEGIENAAIADAVADMPADEWQGFHYARPMPADALSQWLRHWQTTPR